MKKYKTALILLALVFCSTTSFAQDSLGTRIKLKSPSSVSENANKGSTDSDDSANSSNSSNLSDNPFLNGYMNGMANMMNGMANNSFNPQEQQKQQIDYAKQQR